MRAVLILSASFGEGHNAAARNLREALLAAEPGMEAAFHDVFMEAYPRLTPCLQKGYLITINRLPQLWQVMFKVLDHTAALESHIGIYGAAARRLQELIDTLRPEVVVSTYPGCNHLLDAMYRGRTRPFRTVTVITDSLTINSVWLRPHSDYLLAPNAQTAEVVAEAGAEREKIRVFGFPVPRIFAPLAAGEKKAPEAGEPWKVLYAVNSGHHVAAHIVRELLRVPGIALRVTVGRRDDLGREIRAVAEKEGREVEIYGWTPEMARLMAESHFLISKAGGATVQEALAARTPMIITQVIPGQEEGNARLLTENGAGVLATAPREIAEKVREATEEGGALWKKWLAGAEALGHPDAADRTAEFVLGLGGKERGA